MKPFRHFSKNIVNPNNNPPLMEQKPQTVSYNIQIPKEWDMAIKEVCEKEQITKSLFTRSTMKYWFDDSSYPPLLD